MRRGFTLIELMIVIAIIAIIAAIAIPGLLQSQRASNERNASASLKTLASAQADFRANDRDGNKVNDFWTLDVSGLYGVVPAGAGNTEMVKLIEMSIAGADFNADPAGAATPAAGNTTKPIFYTNTSPKAGFWYRALINDDDATPQPYRQDTQGAGWSGTVNAFNHSKFGFQAFPDSKSSGRQIFYINEGNSVFKRAPGATYAKPAATPPSAADFPSGSLGGSSSGIKFPNDLELKTDYGKLD